MWTFCSHIQTQCFTLKVEGGSFLSLHLSRSTKVTQWPLLLTEVGQAAAMLCANASCDGTLCFLLLTPPFLCAGRRKVEQTCGHSLHSDRAGRCQAGQEKVGNVLGGSVFPRTLVPLDVHPSLAAATQQCHEFHTQWLSKLVTLAAAEGREAGSQEESQSGTQQRSFPVCLGPCWVMVEGVAPERSWKLFSAFSSFVKAGIASVLLVTLTEVEKKGMKWKEG